MISVTLENTVVICYHHVFIYCDKCKKDFASEKCTICDTPKITIIKEDVISTQGEFDLKKKVEKFQKVIDEATEFDKEIDNKRKLIIDEHKREMDKLEFEHKDKIRKVELELDKQRVNSENARCAINLYKRLSEKNRKTTYEFESRFMFDENKKRIFKEPDFIINHKNWIGSLACVTTNSKGQYLFCDNYGPRIQIYDNKCIPLKEIMCHHEDQYLVFITVDDMDDIYISTNCNIIYKYNNDGSKLLNELVSLDEEAGEFNNPKGIFINPKNRDILIADSWNDRIQIYDHNFNFLRKFGDGKLGCPIGITMNSKDEILVSDHGNGMIKVFDYEGKYLRAFGYTDNDHFEKPTSLFIDESKNIFVLSGGNIKIVNVFDKNEIYIGTIEFENQKEIKRMSYDKLNNTLMVCDLQIGVCFYKL